MIVIKKPENKPEIKNEIFFTHNDDSFSKPKEDEKETER